MQTFAKRVLFLHSQLHVGMRLHNQPKHTRSVFSIMQDDRYVNKPLYCRLWCDVCMHATQVYVVQV